MLMHLSFFIFAPISTIILWILAKDKDSRANIHGKNIVNAFISYNIYAIIMVVVPMSLLTGMAMMEVDRNTRRVMQEAERDADKMMEQINKDVEKMMRDFSP